MSSKKLRFILENKLIKHVSIIVLCILCYGDNLRGDFVFDDTVAIVKNSDVTSPRKSFREAFSHDFWGGNLTSATSHKSYRPLTTLTFRLEAQFYGLDPNHMKFVNFLLHVSISCFLMEFSGLFLPNSPATSFIGSALFACHPIHTEAVSGIVGRAELLTCLIFIGSSFFYLKQIKSSKHNKVNSFRTVIVMGIVGLLTIVAVLFKENGITILPFCLVLDLIYNTNLHDVLISFKRKRLQLPKQVIWRSLILIFMTIFIVFVRFMVVGFKNPVFKVMDNPVAASSNLVVRITNQTFLYALNFWLLICPDWLSFDWALGSITLITSWTDPRLISIFLFIVFILLIFTNSTKSQLVFLALLVVAFLPASGIIKLGFVIAERVLYIPSIGYTVLVAAGFEKLSKKFENSREISKILRYAMMLTLIGFVLKTRQRASEWTSEEKLFASGLRVCPNNAKVHYNIARLATDQGDKEKAFQFYHSAIKLFPEYESALMNLGNLYREIGDFKTAEKYLEKSIEIFQEFPAAWMNLGIVQASLGKHKESLSSYKTAMTYKPFYPTCLYNLGNLYIEMKEYDKALQSWQEVITMNPKHVKAWSNILALLDNQGKTDQLLQISILALQAVPNEPGILFTRANAFGKLGKFTESEELFLKIIRDRPNVAIYYANLGVLYHRWKKYSKAKQYYLEALHVDPNLQSARDNLKKLA